MTAKPTRPLALIIGVGSATGSAVCAELAADYRLAMVARTTPAIETLASRYDQANAYPCDVTNSDSWISTLTRIVDEMGQPNYVLINTEGGGWGDYTQLSTAELSSIAHQPPTSHIPCFWASHQVEPRNAYSRKHSMPRCNR